MEVVGIRVEMPLNAPVLLLKETAGQRVLPLWIGRDEATLLSTILTHEAVARPLIHDVLVRCVAAGGHRIEKVVISDYREGVFVARLETGEYSVTARPSDAIAVALLAHAPITCLAAVLEVAGVVLEDPTRDLLTDFARFLDTTEPADFD